MNEGKPVAHQSVPEASLQIDLHDPAIARLGGKGEIFFLIFSYLWNEWTNYCGEQLLPIV
jgi:hypothetical protein